MCSCYEGGNGPGMKYIYLSIALLTVLANSSYGVVEKQHDGPNVIVFLADDAGWGDYGASGNRHAHTPHIDALARDGVSLDRFFVCPVCSPTRAEFLTGRWWPRTGVRGVSTGQERLNLNEKTIANAFQSAGYATGCFGKWHNGSQWPYHPMARGFDTYYGHPAGHWGEYFDPPLEREGRMERAKGFIVDVCTNEAIDFIQRSVRKGPFFCYVPFTTPHTPWAVPHENWLRFSKRDITQRATDVERENVDETRCALAMLENQDFNVGRILSTIKELGVQNNTIVVYFSDNGPNTHRWTGGMAGKKGMTDEGGVRSVCFIRWPEKLPKGHTVHEITSAVDLLPTLTSLAGIAQPEGGRPIDGQDLVPLLKNASPLWTERYIFSTWGNKVSVRSQQYRLDASKQLFDMYNDPSQSKNIATEKPAIYTTMTQALNRWQQDVWKEEIQIPKGKGAVDPRPIGVGYHEFPITMLPARDGEPHGCVMRSAKAPNCSYFVHWNAIDGKMIWNVDVQSSGQYEVVIDYTCPSGDEGALVEVSCNGSQLQGRVKPAFDPPLYTNQDTLPRPKAESQMKKFHPLNLGRIHLQKGKGQLVLRALDIPGQSVMDVRRVTLTLLPE